jgi:hypothetical protein
MELSLCLSFLLCRSLGGYTVGNMTGFRVTAMASLPNHVVVLVVTYENLFFLPLSERP